MATTLSRSRKRCKVGNSCGSTCIAKNKKCLVDLPSPTSSALGKATAFLKKHGVHIAEHGAKGVVAWKAGKVLAPVVTGFLESHYGIPREASSQMAETVIQAVAATALEAKHLKDADTFVKKLVSETAAAYLGKAAHGGVEHALATEEAKGIISTAAPILAGKVTGITTALAGEKAPTPKELVSGIIRRSREDTNKLLSMLRPKEVAFAENDNKAISQLLADIAVAALISAQG